MESIGRLAGGIAHDFNNLLTAILGYSEVILLSLGPHEALRAKIETIRTTAEKAAATGKVKYFEGTPIPTSILIVLLLGVAFSQQAIENDLWFGVLRLGPAMLHPLTLLYAVSGTAMISTFRIPKP